MVAISLATASAVLAVLSPLVEGRIWHFNAKIWRYDTYNNETDHCVGQIGERGRKVRGDGSCQTWDDGQDFGAVQFEWDRHNILWPLDYMRGPDHYGDCTLNLYEDLDCRGRALGGVYHHCHTGFHDDSGVYGRARSVRLSCCETENRNCRIE